MSNNSTVSSLLITPEDAAVICCVPKSTILRWAYRSYPAPDGFPAALKVGGKLRYRNQEIINYINKLQPATGRKGKGAKNAT